LRSSSTTSTVAAIGRSPRLSACPAAGLPGVPGRSHDPHFSPARYRPTRLAARLHTVTMSASPGPHDHGVH
jgi:hypothetical protein